MSASAGSSAISARPLSTLSAARQPSRTRSTSASSAAAPARPRSARPASSASYSCSDRAGGSASTSALHDRGPASASSSADGRVRRPGQPQPLGGGQPVEQLLRRTAGRGRAAAAGGRRAGAGPRPRRWCRRRPARPVAPSSTSAGNTVTRCPARVSVVDSSIVPNAQLGLAGPRQAGVLGHLGHRRGELRAQRLLERLEVLAAGLLRRRCRRPRGTSAAGGRAPSTSPRPPAGTTTPVVERSHRSSASSIGSSPGGTAARNSFAVLGAGTKLHPQVLGQRPDQAGDQLLAQPGHVPGEVVGLDPVEGGDRDLDGEAVVGGARLEVVADREGQPLLAAVPLLREVGLADLLRGVVGEHRRVEGEQLRVAVAAPASTTGRSGRR